MKKITTEPVKTILTISIGFLVVFLATDWKWAIYLSLIIGLIGMFSPFLSKQVDFLWMKLAWVLSLIVPKILLSLIFYVFLFPIATLSKLFGAKDPLMLKGNNKSTFRATEKVFEKSTFEKMW
jgi:hypothetical protein